MAETPATLWTKYHTIALTLIVQLVFAGYLVLAGQVLKSSTLPALAFAFYRDVFASSVLLVVAYVWTGAYRLTKDKAPTDVQLGLEHQPAHVDTDDPSRRFWPAKADTAQFILLGLLGVYGTQGMSALGLANLPSAYCGLLVPLQPVSALIFALIAGQERIQATWASAAKVIGILITVGGAIGMGVLANFSDGNALSVVQQSKSFGAGSLYMAIQVASAGAYAVAQKPTLSKYPPVVVAAWAYTYGTGLLLMAALPLASDASSWTIPSWKVAGAITYAALFSSCFCYAAMSYVIQKTSAVFLVAFNPLQGLFGALLSAFVVGESIGAPEIVGGCLISLGLLLTVSANIHEQRLVDKHKSDAVPSKGAACDDIECTLLDRS